MAYLSLRDLRDQQLHEFDGTEIRIGRDPDGELAIAGEGSDVVSGQHAVLGQRDGRWSVEDVGSRNGTFLNDRRLAPSASEPVRPGDVIRLGERGPRLRVEAIARRAIADTIGEASRGVVRPSAPTLPLAASDEQAAPPAVRVTLLEARTGERYDAAGARLRLGRGKECEVRPIGQGDTAVSRVHAEVVCQPDGRAMLSDAGSRNGTYLNGALLVGARSLKRGDRVQLGEGGPELTVLELDPGGGARRAGPSGPAAVAAGGGADADAAAPAPTAVPATGGAPSRAARAADKMGAPRRSFGGQGATAFFRDMFRETERKNARRVRWVVWSSLALLTAAVGVFYWFSERLEAELERQLGAQQAVADSIRTAANAEYERLRAELTAAQASSAPAAVVESLRVALVVAEQRTAALETALERAQAALARQLAAGDSARRAAQAELERLRAQLSRASATGTPTALLDSLRAAVRAAEDRATAIASQLRAVQGVNLAAVAQANQAAIGLVTAFAGGEIFDGSGFAISRSGYFVTNRHVVTDQDRPVDSVFVTMADQRQMQRADLLVVAQPSGPDLAVLRIRAYTGPHVAKVDWAGANVRQGEPAALIGFPAGLGNALDETRAVRTSMSAGIFSRVTSEYINFDGFTVGGSSGSPIFNAAGEVVAVHRAGLRQAVGFGFAVPVPQLVALLPADAKAELGLP